ncbi:SDR family oxidoreductase [Cellulomonas sp.]|uniref:SDR family oxidoreductase n=1 Tax=Cellulomonas sp. TaxID=40001 RepID=UPI001B273B42|nr:SDR family oxidoreductase [Cellulomonas sp.]MBO9553925.1 SDR family oxidoreductase [Cellulomonas sp.]
MYQHLHGQRVLVVGGARDLGLAIARAVTQAGATAIIGARDAARATAAADGLAGAEAVRIDVGDEATIAAALDQVGAVDHVVVTASAHHNVPVTELDHARTVAAFEAKVVGPLLVAKHAAPRLPAHGSIVLFSGVAAWNPAPGYTVMGITNGAVAFAVQHLAAELAPVRVNAVSPGIVDSGSWDRLGDGKGAFLAGAADGTLVGRTGTNDDVTDAVVWLLGAGFVSGETIHVEGGARLR